MFVIEALHARHDFTRFKCRHQSVCFVVRSLLGICAELNDEPRVAVRKHRTPVGRHPFVMHVHEHACIKTFERDWSVRVAEGNVVGSSCDIRKSEDDHRAKRRTVHEPHLCFDYRHARIFGADERSSNIETVFGQ